MNRGDDDSFRVRPGAPKNRQQRFVSQVLREVNKAGGRSPRRPTGRPGSRLGRGHTAARFTSRGLSRKSRRVAVKARLVNLHEVGARSTPMHLRYIEREGVGPDGERGKAYGSATDEADLDAFERRGRDDRHQFRFIVSPEDAEELNDLRSYTRHLMQRMEADLGTSLDWVAVDHWNTDNPHTHIVLRGKDDTGRDLIISRDYIAHGMRERAAGLATEWLGPRTEQEIRRSLEREVEQPRWTSLDRALQREAQAGTIRLERLSKDSRRAQLIGRLNHLQRMGLAESHSPGEWTLRPDTEPVLRALGERGDIVRTMQRAMSGVQRELVIFKPAEGSSRVIGRVVAKGLADELYDRGYLVIDGIDGKAHYVALPARAELDHYPTGAIVEARDSTEVRATDRTVAALAVEGLYRTDHHRAVEMTHESAKRDPDEVVTAHVRRLEALRRAGIVERVTEGVWRVPSDLPERGRQYDARFGGTTVTVRSHLSIEQQKRAVGATWLDQQLIVGGKDLGERGFGADVRDMLRQRVDFLVEHGLAQRRGQHVILARNLLATLRERDLETAALRIAKETGLEHRPIIDGGRASGVYRRNILLPSGRFALLDDGIGFSLAPWKPVIERQLGRQLAATVRGGGVSWEIGRQRGPLIG